MRSLRRFLVVVALMFWQGGFLFYVSVVVPTGSKVLRSDRRQGFITREVTRQLNVAAGLALLVVAWEVLANRDPSRGRRRARAILWLFMAACQGGLFWLHAWLDGMMVSQGMLIRDRAELPFYTAHRMYLWLHTFQWAAAVAFVLLLVIGWGREDRREGSEAHKKSAVDYFGVAQSPK